MMPVEHGGWSRMTKPRSGIFRRDLSLFAGLIAAALAADTPREPNRPCRDRVS